MSYKIELARQHGIKVDYILALPKKMPLSELDMVSLLGNLWNNALESCKRMKDKEPGSNAYIDFYMKLYKEMLLVHIENPYDGVIKTTSDGEYLSLKDESGHGVGLRRIRSITENAGGIMMIHAEHNVFMVHIILPGVRILD